MRIFSKDLEIIEKSDIEQLIAEQVPESDHVEFKKSLPAYRGVDPWELGENKIGDKARNEILEEVVAFGNAHGGHLLLGIDETNEKPPRASAITPIQRCMELAEKLRLQARDCIEPQLPIFHTAGIETDGKGGGVVIIRIPQSRLAPHRLIQTKECYIRRADRSEKMTMREIQDLTLNTQRGLEAINNHFNQMRKNFYSRIKKIKTHGYQSLIAIRTTCVPISGELYIEQVYNSAKVEPVYEFLNAHFANGTPFLLDIPSPGLTPRPILRGTQIISEGNNFLNSQEVFCNGVVSYNYISELESTQKLLSHTYPLGIAVNTILTAHKFRLAAGAPDVEYGLELEIYHLEGPLIICTPNFLRRIGQIDTSPLIFPRYSIGSADEFENIITLIMRDLWHSAGSVINYNQKLSIQFHDLINQWKTI